VPVEALQNPELQRDDLAWRKPILNFTEICERTGLSRATVSSRLHELLMEGVLARRRQGKDQLYSPRSLDECDQEIVLNGPRKMAQFRRLAQMGLPVSWETLPRGRPKRIPNREEICDKITRLTRSLLTLPAPARRYVVKQAGLIDQSKDGRLLFCYRGKRISDIRKAIPKARKHYKQLFRQSKPISFLCPSLRRRRKGPYPIASTIRRV
jgi:DNA-binding transcriptional ArsR family regulator